MCEIVGSRKARRKYLESGTILLDQPEIEARAYAIRGRELKPKVLQKRLSENSVVLISTDGNFPSRQYCQYLKPRTVAFVFNTGGLIPLPNQQSIHIKQETTALKDDIRREAFLSVSRTTTQHEIESYVSDNFDIIVRGAIFGMNDKFLDSLWNAYNEDEIPTPKTGK